MKKKWIFLIVAVAILAVGAWRIFGNISKFNVTPPKSETSVLVPLRTTPSSITLPINIPISAMENFLEQSIPKQHSGSESRRITITKFPRIRTSLHTSWEVNRSNFSVIGNVDLRLSTRVTGRARLRSRLLPGGTRVDIRGTLTGVARPEIKPNWRLTVPNLAIRANLNNATARIIGVRFSVRGKIQPKLNSWATKQTSKFKTRLAEDDFLEKAVKKHWKKLCRSFPLDSETGLWLEVKPVAVRAAQPVIDHENIRLQLGLDAETRVVTEQTKPNCPFPSSLIIESPKDGRIEIILPTRVDYSTLQELLKKQVVGKTVREGDISLTIKDIKLQPHGDSLLLQIELAARAGGWLGARTEGTLYLLAKPILNAEAQTIKFENIDLDTASKNTLTAVVAETAEPLLLNIINKRATLDLKPILGGKLHNQADTAIKGLSSDGLAINSKVEDIRLSRLDVGPSHLRLIANARAKAEVSIQKIKQFGR